MQTSHGHGFADFEGRARQTSVNSPILSFVSQPQRISVDHRRQSPCELIRQSTAQRGRKPLVSCYPNECSRPVQGLDQFEVPHGREYRAGYHLPVPGQGLREYSDMIRVACRRFSNLQAAPAFAEIGNGIPVTDQGLALERFGDQVDSSVRRFVLQLDGFRDQRACRPREQARGNTRCQASPTPHLSSADSGTNPQHPAVLALAS